MVCDWLFKIDELHMNSLYSGLENLESVLSVLLQTGIASVKRLDTVRVREMSKGKMRVCPIMC